MKLFQRIALGFILLLLAFLTISYFTLNQKIPKGVSGPEADQFAHEILKSIAHQKYSKTQYLQWSFRNKHHYLWDKKSQSVNVSWGMYVVQLDLNNPQQSVVQKPHDLSPDQKTAILQKALAFFHNDSFWVVAPHKLFDPGVTRELVTLKDQKKALLVTYHQGGTTPGDSYLWHVDETYRPISYQMWVGMLPVGGLEASWSNWKPMESGTFLATEHQLLGLEIPINNLRAWND